VADNQGIPLCVGSHADASSAELAQAKHLVKVWRRRGALLINLPRILRRASKACLMTVVERYGGFF